MASRETWQTSRVHPCRLIILHQACNKWSETRHGSTLDVLRSKSADSIFDFQVSRLEASVQSRSLKLLTQKSHDLVQALRVRSQTVGLCANLGTYWANKATQKRSIDLSTPLTVVWDGCNALRNGSQDWNRLLKTIPLSLPINVRPQAASHKAKPIRLVYPPSVLLSHEFHSEGPWSSSRSLQLDTRS